MDAAAPQPSSRLRTFTRRLFSFVVLWSVVLGAMFSGHRVISDAVFLIIMVLLAGFGLAEFYDLARQRGLACFRYWGIIGGVLLMLATFAHFRGLLGISGTPSRVNDFETGFLILFVLGLCVRQFLSKANAQGLVAISTTLFGLMYVPWLLNFIQKINYFPGVEGTYYLLYFLLVTKMSDAGAYAIGSVLGKHKMIPRISPGKTWEGFGGALFASMLASVVFAHFVRNHLAGMTVAHAMLLGLLLGAAAVVGDLIESLFKREAGVKDSGHYFPGIGGLLDLVDSLLFNAPLMYLYLRHVLTTSPPPGA